MNDALTLTVQAMHSDLQRVDTLSRNMVNATTPGYRRQISISRPFFSHMSQLDMAVGAQISIPATDLSAGAIKQTQRTLDLAIQDNSFFVVQSDGGVAYTRQGNFQVDGQGRLVTASGHPLLGQQGEITVGFGEINIDKQGLIIADGKPVDRLRFAKFDPDIQMRSLGNCLLIPSETVEPTESGNTVIASGSLEAANVVPLREMMSLMETMRHFEASQRLVQAYDETLGKSIQKLGEF
ncbi:flagellar basal-body rod protein FlgG [Chitinivorax tropicus]|uniref:Flagellar basal-body rod protein FlgG n=1 Tax=Chitinivorax tropicus TaxID=714531 RepID=A0A840MSC5_9PROT|nr:flagellar hook basal-body protein [Chitinivorax tropicus]MBB5020315.1 flagellar basal-body rod protein FlgG [Chitinivorax tropicus]